MTTPTLDEQVAELMRRVNELCADSYDDGYHQRPFNPSRMEIYADVEAFARAALDRSAVALRYRFPGDLQWQYTERRFQASPGSEVEFLSVIPKETP